MRLAFTCLNLAILYCYIPKLKICREGRYMVDKQKFEIEDLDYA